jgi:polyvinyl alcohol dehydrogenase (cytochrome)
MSGDFYAIDAATGIVLWSYKTAASINCGAAIAGDSVYIGSGYSHFGFGTPGNTLYAFSVH